MAKAELFGGPNDGMELEILGPFFLAPEYLKVEHLGKRGRAVYIYAKRKTSEFKPVIEYQIEAVQYRA